MDKFDLKIKNSKPNALAKDDFADLVMSKVARSTLSIWTGRLLIGFLAVSIGFLTLNIFASNELKSLAGMLINDFDIISNYPSEFIIDFALSLPWLNLASVLGVGLIAIWYFRSLKSYVS